MQDITGHTLILVVGSKSKSTPKVMIKPGLTLMVILGWSLMTLLSEISNPQNLKKNALEVILAAVLMASAFQA